MLRRVHEPRRACAPAAVSVAYGAVPVSYAAKSALHSGADTMDDLDDVGFVPCVEVSDDVIVLLKGVWRLMQEGRPANPGTFFQKAILPDSVDSQHIPGSRELRALSRASSQRIWKLSETALK
jgi:hypothetical protein